MYDIKTSLFSDTTKFYDAVKIVVWATVSLEMLVAISGMYKLLLLFVVMKDSFRCQTVRIIQYKCFQHITIY